ncbi:F-box protein, partial [Aspergillus ibericus CBS 121593]
MLSQFPPELLAMVLNYLTRTDLKRLGEVSRDIYSLTTPYLYQSLVISAARSSPQNINGAITQLNPAHLVHTRDLRLYGPYHGMRADKTCSFHDSSFFGNEHPGLQVGILSILLMHYPNPHSWDLGTCLPDELVHRINAIFQHQPQITSISLITDSDCKMNASASSHLNLTPLSILHSLSWKGLKRYQDFESIREFITTHGPQLKTLHLDLIGWDSTRLSWTQGFLQHSPPDPTTILPENFFTQHVLNLHPGNPLPSLHHLSLTQTSFLPLPTSLELPTTLNIANLHSLHLTNCPGTFPFLRQITHSNIPLHLKHLEITFNPEQLNQLNDETQDNLPDTIHSFLGSFSGLTDLYLMLPSIAWESPATWEGIAHHNTTLKHLITHRLQRTEYGGFEDGDLFMSIYDQLRVSHLPGLEFFGVSVAL